MANRETILWKAILGALCACIAFLVLGIVIVSNGKQAESDRKEGMSLTKQAQAEIAGLDDTDVSAAIEIYQKYIDLADSEEKVEIYADRIRYIADNNSEMSFNEQIIDDYIKIDEIVQSINSAIQVINALLFYKNHEALLEKYNELLRIREDAEGLNMDMETIG